MRQDTKISLVIPGRPGESPYPMQMRKPLLGVGFLAGMLEREGFSTEIIDAFVEDLSAGETLQRIRRSGSRIVGISLHLLAYEFASELSRLCRREGLKVIIGGPEVTLNCDGAIGRVGCDAAVLGEGDAVIVELVRTLCSGRPVSPAELARIPGVACQARDGRIIHSQARERITDLDELPFVPYEKFPLHLYDLRQDMLAESNVLPVYTSRGCPYNCSFCSSREIWYRQCHFMSAQRVLAEIDNIVARYSPAGLYFQDDHFALNRSRVAEICQGLIARDLHLPWMCLARAQGLDEELFRLMKRAGCRGLWFGIESGSRRILDMIRKEIDLDEALGIIQAGKRAGLAVGASIIVGFPTQTMAEEMQTIAFLRKARCTFVYMSPYVGYPGSDIYRQFLAGGGKYVHSQVNGIVLPNSESMTWPEKVEWARRYGAKFNRTFRHFRHQARALGLACTVRKAGDKLAAALVGQAGAGSTR